MAIKVSKTRYGTRYLALYRNVDGKQKSAGTFSDRKLAEAAYMDAMAKVKRGIDPTRKAESVRPVGTETVESRIRSARLCPSSGRQTGCRQAAPAR